MAGVYVVNNLMCLSFVQTSQMSRANVIFFCLFVFAYFFSFCLHYFLSDSITQEIIMFAQREKAKTTVATKLEYKSKTTQIQWIATWMHR